MKRDLNDLNDIICTFAVSLESLDQRLPVSASESGRYDDDVSN